LLEYQENPRHPAELRFSSKSLLLLMGVSKFRMVDDIEKLRPELNIEGLENFLM